MRRASTLSECKEERHVWTLTKLLPKWPRNDRLTGKDLRGFSEDLRDWYFGGGGMFLSHESVKAYKNLQNELTGYLTGQEDLAKPLLIPDYDRVRDFCSALRTELSRSTSCRGWRAATST